MRRYTLLTALILLGNFGHAQTLPEGFNIETVTNSIEYPAGMAHSELGIAYVWELPGKVWAMENGVVDEAPLLDISEEVGFWSDHGLLSMVLDPNFSDNGYFYLLYVVDRHHLLHFGTENYDPQANDYEDATIGRVVRYQINLSDPHSLEDTPRKVLIGEDITRGIPICTTSHGLGTLLFGTDGSLFFSVGDSNAPGSDYNGSGEVPAAAYDGQALLDGIIKPGENVGAFRSQFIDSYCGKVIRIDPETGLGLPNNPFYDQNDPDAPRSKVWSLGFRNPFRMTLVPNSGSANPADNNPGNIILGDVGDWSWEEINLIHSPRMNFGWPIYQGVSDYYQFIFNWTEDITNSLDGACDQEYLYFQDMIVNPKPDHNEVWEDPCGGFLSPEVFPLFVHEPPVLAYTNSLVAPPDLTVIPGFDQEENLIALEITQEALGIDGAEMFSGVSSIGGVFYNGAAYPPEYYGAYFQADFIGWLKVFYFSEEGVLQKLENWTDQIGNVVHISLNPLDECVYLVGLFPGSIKKISFEGNLKPVIEVDPDTIYGSSPLNADFDASGSYDPEGTALSFNWDFGDGITGTGSLVNHTFTADQPQSFTVIVTAIDQEGLTAQKEVLVSLNNTPPQVNITSIGDNYLYSIFELSEIDLFADISDYESPIEELEIRWRLFLHHNTHFHLEQTFVSETADVQLQPLGCGIEEFWYRLVLTVTDPQGLVAKDEVLMFPDCNGISTGLSDLSIYPNPVQRSFNLSLTGGPPVDWMEVELYTSAGKLLKKSRYVVSQTNQQVRVSSAGLADGVYILIIRTNLWEQKRNIIKVSK